MVIHLSDGNVLVINIKRTIWTERIIEKMMYKNDCETSAYRKENGDV